MSGDAYGKLARLQDAVLEPLNAPLRDIAVSMVEPQAGMRVLDVGCGTGAQLERYLAAGCAVAGIDSSSAMLLRARERLGEGADLRLVDAQHIPFEDGTFDLVSATLVLHELTADARDNVLAEMLRVLKEDGRILIVDFHPGPARGAKGLVMRAVSFVAESIARHRDRSKAFLSAGGVPGLADSLRLEIGRTKIVSGGNIGLYLLTAPPYP